jgi:hypothetical protein
MFSLREQLIATGAIRPAGSGKPILRVDAIAISAACTEILQGEGTDVAAFVIENPSADPRVRARLVRALERAALNGAPWYRRSNVRAVA